MLLPLLISSDYVISLVLYRREIAKEAEEVVAVMKEFDVPLNVVTYTTLLALHSRKSDQVLTH